MSITIVYVAIVGQNYGGVEQKIISQFDALKQYRSNVFLYLLTSFPPRGAFAEASSISVSLGLTCIGTLFGH